MEFLNGIFPDKRIGFSYTFFTYGGIFDFFSSETSGELQIIVGQNQPSGKISQIIETELPIPNKIFQCKQSTCKRFFLMLSYIIIIQIIKHNHSIMSLGA